MQRSGFTLLELAIVLVIIGFVVSAAISSISIIKTSESKKIIVQATVLANAQNRYFEQTGRFAGDSDNDGRIDFADLQADSGEINGISDRTPDVDDSFIELKKLGILSDENNYAHASLAGNGFAYYAGVLNDRQVLNVLVLKDVSCMTAFQMEQTIDKNKPDDKGAKPASSDRIRWINGNSISTVSQEWTSTAICGSDSKKPVSIAYLFDRF
ncbi:hypothetical protein Dacet_0342 [Denitrovibrio acetiphilus DSM 12809]|uniref:Prepilin-type N-terminal cleavage/methylation domain-containing protein n=1 Tax=Denitrovibrio acetiphilus (strain DSM 12809 / NBRC 114555 / N2460) TaxID=522772 RepID=D4H2T1_DENA2|nr:type II secretion system protein [Denitrovibrio acetiphilus]ADD67142.1 hypothetical protein Dacet_0342 [Denitrovibrio acetiphilus DSM 12809]